MSLWVQTYVHHGTCCQKHPDRNDGYLHHEHVGYGPQPDQFPKILHLSGVLQNKLKEYIKNVCRIVFLLQYTYSALSSTCSDLRKYHDLSETRTIEDKISSPHVSIPISHHIPKTPLSTYLLFRRRHKVVCCSSSFLSARR